MSSRTSSYRGKRANEKSKGARPQGEGNSSIKAEAQLYQGRSEATMQRLGKHGSSNRLDDFSGDGQSERRADSSWEFKVSDRVSYKSSNGYARTGIIDTTHPSDGNATTCMPDKECHSSSRSHSDESSTSTVSPLKAISLWQPWAFPIPMRLKHYETRGWKTDYKGRLLIASAKKLSSSGRQIYLEIARSHGIDLEKHPWHTLPLGYAIAVCDLTDCIQITLELIVHHSQTEIDCGDWTLGRYAWKLEVQPLLKPIPVKGQQGLWNVDAFGEEKITEPLNYTDHPPYPQTTQKKVLLFSKPCPRDPSILGEETGLHEVGSCTCPSSEQPLINLDDGCGVCSWVGSQFLEDKAGNTEMSSRNNSTSNDFLEDMPVDKYKEEISSRNDSTLNNFLEDMLDDAEISSRNYSTSNDFLESDSEAEISSRKIRRRKGDGSGCIYWRTNTKGGKDYSEPYYQYEFWSEGDRLIKSSKYIPKRLLKQVQQLDEEKAPVREILRLLKVRFE